MKRKKIMTCICAFTLAASLIAVDTLSVFAEGAPEDSAEKKMQVLEENYTDEAMVRIENAEEEETVKIEEEAAESEEETAQSGQAEEFRPDPRREMPDAAGTEAENTFGSGAEERQEEEPGVKENNDGLIYVNGVVYHGYYMDSTGIFYKVTNGTAELFTGMAGEGAEYYSCANAATVKMPSQTLFVAGKAYTGYYLDRAGVLHKVTDGAAQVFTGTVKEGTGYYSDSAGIRTLSKKTLYVNGKAYSGYYLGHSKKMYKVKKGTYTPQTGAVKAGTRYYSVSAGKIQKLPKQTLYVKGKVYTGYYLGSSKKMYKVKKGTHTPQTGAVKAGTRYYSIGAGKMQKLSKKTLYVKGKAYTGYYLGSSQKLYKVKKGRYSLQTGIIDAGTRYYHDKAGKMQKLSKQTLYVKGKVYTGYYLDIGNIMYSAEWGTCTLLNAALNAGTGYYSYHAKKMLALPGLTVYINGKAIEGMSAASLATLQRAQAVVSGITNNSMSKEEKLRICFNFVKGYGESKPRIPHYKGMDWPVIYANDMFINRTGNCCSYAAAFAYMAKAIGYEEVYCCNSGGHGWAEIDGLVYDPEWSKWHHVYNYYALSYDTKTDQDYKGAIGARLPWMRIKI